MGRRQAGKNSYMLTSVSTTPSSSTSREHSLDELVKLNLRRHYGSIDNMKNNMRIYNIAL